MNYLMKKRLALMKNKQFRGQMKTVSGYPLTLSNCMENGLVSLDINGDNIGESNNDQFKVPILFKGMNLFDITEIQHNNITISDNVMYVYQSGAHITNLSPELFLKMTGLNPGDEILTSLNKSIIKSASSPGVWGKLTFIGKNGNKSFVLCEYNVDIMLSTIPDNFNSGNYGNLSIYGATLDDNGESLIQIENIVMTSKVDNKFYTSGDIDNPHNNLTIERTGNIYTLNGSTDNEDKIILARDITNIISSGSEFVILIELLSGEINVPSGYNGYIQLSGYSGFVSLSGYKNGRINTLTQIKNDDAPNLTLYCLGSNSVEFNNAKIKITIVENKAPKYEPYHEGQKFDVHIQSPSDNINVNFKNKTVLADNYDLSSLQNWNDAPKLWDGTVNITADTTIPPTSMEASYYSSEEE